MRQQPTARELRDAAFQPRPPKAPTFTERFAYGVGFVFTFTLAACIVCAAVCGCVWLIRITF